MEGTTIERRRFVNWFLGTGFGALIASVLYPIVRYVSPPRIPEAAANQVDAGPANDPQLLEKGFKIARFGAEPVLLVRLSDTDFRAYSATCTHLDCIVTYQKDQTRIFCNCHGGQYDMNGRNVGGPPPRPLTVFKVNLVTKKAGDPPNVVISKA
jgi:cytochrome b6-f complex iron-sulfur subunit